jgi:hypothetical protein
MKPALPELQAAFAMFLAGGDERGFAAEIVGDTIGAEARLRIYRHHVRHSLTTVLATTFPTVQALVGEEFFAALSRDFLERDLPRQPVLSEYGAGFADFIAGFEPARGLPYLADMARLDWALNLAFHTDPGARLDGAALEAIAPEHLTSLRVRLANGVSLLSSPFPLDRIWSASQPGAPDDKVEMTEGKTVLLVRADGFVALQPGEAAFLTGLAAGETLGQAAAAGLSAEPRFDLSTCFARFLGTRVLAALQHDDCVT